MFALVIKAPLAGTSPHSLAQSRMSTRGMEAQKLNDATPSDATPVAPLPAIAPNLDGTALHASPLATPLVVHADPIMVQPERNIIGGWSSGLFACCSDCCTFLTVFFIPCVPVAQLAHQFNAFGMKPSCKLVAALLGVVWIIQSIIQPMIIQEVSDDNTQTMGEGWDEQAWNEQANEQANKKSAADVLVGKVLNVGSTILFIISLIPCLVVMNVRAKVRAAHRIPKRKRCGCDEDCCCACICQSCTICQMLRHVLDTSQGSREFTGTQYNVCSENVVAV